MRLSEALTELLWQLRKKAGLKNLSLSSAMSFYFPFTIFSSSHPHNAVRNDKVQTEPTA